MKQSGEQSFFSLSLGGVAGRSVRMWLDKMEYGWAKWVLGYDTNVQLKFLGSVLGNIDSKRMIIAFALTVLLPMSIYFVWGLKLFKTEQHSKLARAYHRCLARLKKYNLEPAVGETPSQFSGRVASKKPELGPWFDEVVSCFEAANYRATPAGEKDSIMKLKRLSKQTLPQ